MNVAIITVSDTVASASAKMLPGRRRSALPGIKIHCCVDAYSSDDPAQIRSLLSKLADAQNIDVILTTGGTGIGPRDSTPEATQAIAERLVPWHGGRNAPQGACTHTSSDSVAWYGCDSRSTLILKFAGKSQRRR